MSNDLIWHKSIFSPPEDDKIFESLPNSLAKIASLLPDSTAVICNGKKYSFNDLACRSAGLADEINEATQLPGPVALVQSISFDVIAAWFACAIAGRAFILLEPDHPPARLFELIENANCALVLGDSKTIKVLSNLPKLNLLISDGRMGKLLIDKGLSFEEPAMIFPTSGSSGKPKLITYSATTIQVKVQSSIKLMRVPKEAKVLIAGSHGNYGFLHHALVFLLSGGSICLEDVKVRGFTAIIQAINHLGVRHIRFTPSMFRKLAALPQAIDALRRLDGVRFSGEPLLANDLRLAHSVLKPECLIQNVYGSTESALFIWSSNNDKMQLTEPTVPIGWVYPLASYAIRPIEGEQWQATVGELLIKSTFHALGDFKNGTIDQERFSEFAGSKNERIYKTGDIVEKLPDGSLIHLGRIGRMVKIRGHRVFLTEVENHLQTIPGITGAAIVDRTERDGVVLYGFITINDTNITVDFARNWLKERLPDFMLPKSIEIISEIPLLIGGKVDYLTLIKNIQSFHTQTNLNTTAVDDFTRLTQLWDSILWEGAHTHDADFLALGGDSISLMILSVEIERIFGRSLPIESFRIKSTLQNLAAILEIESPQSAIVKNEFLRVKQVLPNVESSKGIVLAMPGVGGWAPALRYREAGFFQDHDLWVADYLINKGSMLQFQRWWKAALEIVKSIRDGSIPQPRVIIGFSFGGGLAWLVSRLLAGSPQCPQFVIMVDAPPLHRIRTFRIPALIKALAQVPPTQLPPVLHIRRAPLPKFGVGGSIDSWESDDNIQMLVDLPTVNHSEMVIKNMLMLATEAVSLFLNQAHTINPWKPKLQPPDILGVHIYTAIHGNQTSLIKVMDEFKNTPNKFNIEHLITLIFVMYIRNDNEKAKELICHIIKEWPNAKTAQYLYRRMQRNPNMLLSKNIPTFYPLNLACFETSLANSQKVFDHAIPRSIKLLCMAYDVVFSILSAQWVRWKFKISPRR
ncbi:AMP-binding protein [Sediminibacterium sp.]|uniref:non-ribosomal peptide synthetase n=1 Tax=Sediminibacterium sp. TaxID=1917865 RepID=UPI003F70CAA3